MEERCIQFIGIVQRLREILKVYGIHIHTIIEVTRIQNPEVRSQNENVILGTQRMKSITSLA